MSSPVITINIVVHNGEKYIRRCLDSVSEQSYPHELIEINVFDNTSTDSTPRIAKDFGFKILDLGFAGFFSLKSEKNLGMWPAQEELLKHSHGKYIVILSVDVILHPNFIKNAVEIMGEDPKIGALQAKVYQYKLGSLPATPVKLRHGASNCQLPTTVIDTLGFQIFRSRRIVNIGHGETDHGQYSNPAEIFAVEGAVPVFRRQALEDCRLKSQDNKIIDSDFFWYGDDLDLAWRMRLFGWKQVYAPNVVAWHDRKTTKALAGGWREFIKIRRTIPMFKRRLDWRNTTLAIIKNDFAINLLYDLPYILSRQLRLWTYFLIFEAPMFFELFKVAKMLPKMLKRRREIMQKTIISTKDFRQWIR